MAYAPAVARLECGFFPNDPHGFWQENGYGLLSVFKVDWDRFGGKYESCHSGEETPSYGQYQWGMCHSTRYAFFSCLNLEQDIKITLYLWKRCVLLAHFDSEINEVDFSPLLHPLWNHWRSMQSDWLCVIYS